MERYILRARITCICLIVDAIKSIGNSDNIVLIIIELGWGININLLRSKSSSGVEDILPCSLCF